VAKNVHEEVGVTTTRRFFSQGVICCENLRRMNIIICCEFVIKSKYSK